jgi:hypothetical protein
MMSSSILADRDVNATAEKQPASKDGKEVKSMEYHRQVLQSKLDEGQYVFYFLATFQPHNEKQELITIQRQAILHFAQRQYHVPLHG